MPNKKNIESLSGLVDKMNKTYDGLIGEGFNLGLDRRVVPVMADGAVAGWKMQRLEDEAWVDADDKIFVTMSELITYYKDKDQKQSKTS